jgi:hypothetical protein
VGVEDQPRHVVGLVGDQRPGQDLGEWHLGDSKIMRNQDLILVARKARVVTRLRNTIGLPGTMVPPGSRTGR